VIVCVLCCVKQQQTKEQLQSLILTKQEQIIQILMNEKKEEFADQLSQLKQEM
jgi:Zn ribbon nucleic-acid-binding protein